MSALPLGATTTPSPGPSPSSPPTPTPVPLRTATAAPSAPPTAVSAAPSPTILPSPALAEEQRDDAVLDPPPPALPTALAPPPRVFRTPVRLAPPAFVPPAAPVEPEAPADVESAPARPAAPPPARGGTATVTFRAIARTALEGFNLLVTYPVDAGEFVGSADQVSCTTAAGGLFIPNDHDDGTMNLIVANAQALPFPIAISCRFALAAGATIGSGSFAVHVAEVTSNGRTGDPSLLTVAVDVR